MQHKKNADGRKDGSSNKRYVMRMNIPLSFFDLL